ncbi:MAG: CIA30 family protein [Phycisphaerae bacterium]|nr:CIA30 family protein [Phycisphaerae bacterium]
MPITTTPRSKGIHVFRPKFLLTASLLAACASAAIASPIDLDLGKATGEWRVVLDGVMGGRSTGAVVRKESGTLEFSGNLSLENNGGFSQIRSAVSGDLFAGMHGIEITVRGDGRDYNFDIRCTHARVMAGGFQRTFTTQDGKWTTLRMPFEDFRLHSFGRLVSGAPPIVPTSIESIGITLSDKKPGPFMLEVASIRAFGQTTAEPQQVKDTPPSMAGSQAARLIELAISRGVPLFNDGQPAACAAIYEVTIESLVALGADAVKGSVREALMRSLVDASADSSPAARAWTLRRALDVAYGHLVQHPDAGIAQK